MFSSSGVVEIGDDRVCKAGEVKNRDEPKCIATTSVHKQGSHISRSRSVRS